ncbi:sirohydrochlorin chelatase [Bacillus taeanensis]|uniref:Sirohydrochlorin chelatase n=1 Tax=Bacillus taeanensis TaxID=273032 RepID=A0A366Y0L9_9BACI|nr:sirohydrochlorin chelatase [Bacillus taeanensis]RBW70905.1 sirohydrochlorin chelatase [Bacillus taeanensis]
MQAVLYIGHGSRVREANKQAADFLTKSMKEISVPIQEYCFLELAEPTIAEGIARCAARGASKIAVVPLLLLTAGHAKLDIPEALEKVKKEYPSIEFQYGRPLGVHDRIVDILIERITEQKISISNKTTVLLVGRGSSDPDSPRDLGVIADMLKIKGGFQSVKTCFLAAASPSFKEGLKNAIHSESRQIVVLPYLLFTGILMKDMEKTIAALDKNGKEIILCNYLGYHQNLQTILADRVQEVINNQVYTTI